MQCWLMKSEPDEVSIDDLEKHLGTVPWFGVRNYQARNFMRDAMNIGDPGLFSIIRLRQPGIAGVCEIVPSRIRMPPVRPVQSLP